MLQLPGAVLAWVSRREHLVHRVAPIFLEQGKITKASLSILLEILELSESPLGGKHAMLGAGNLAEGTSGPLGDSSLPGSHIREVGMRSGMQDRRGGYA